VNTLDFPLAGATLTALPSGGLYHASARGLCVSDLHLCKSERIARRTGLMVPPYETRDTLDRLATDIAATDPAVVICLGDSFDDIAASETLDDACRETLMALQAGRDWIWIEGNHDPGPVDLGGTHLAEYRAGGLTYRHIASAETPEISGHYHPKIALPGAGAARACFAFDDARCILPAYGTYTGGLRVTDPALRRLFGPRPHAILTGRRAILAPF